MWSVILPSGYALEGVPELSFELNNQVFSTSDATVLPGSFSFPFDVPLTARNRAELNHPDQVNNAVPWNTYEGCWVTLEGVHLFSGTLTIRRAGGGRVSLDLVANPMGKIANKSLREIDLGGERTLPSPLAAHVDSTMLDPSQHDYCFPPVIVKPPALGPAPFEPASVDRQNKFVSGSYERGIATTPMVRLDYLLRRIFASSGLDFGFQNDFQPDTERELRLLYVYCNKDIYTTARKEDPPEVPATFNLQHFVPPTKVGDALKRICALFCLGVFTDIFNRKITLTPLRNIIAAAPAVDWTKHLASELLLDRAAPAPNYYNYKSPRDPEAAGFPPITNVPRYKNAAEMEAVAIADPWVAKYGSWDDQVRRITWRQFLANFILYRENGGTTSYPYKVPGTEKDVEYNSDCEALPDVDGYRYAAIERYVGSPDPNPTEWALQANEPNFHLLFYRGKQNGFPGSFNNPWATSSVYWPDGAPTRIPIREGGANVDTAKYALFWDGEYGLYSQWHARWANMLQSGKPVTCRFAMPISELINFSFKFKIRLDNMDYIATRLRISKPLGMGRVLVEASLLSII